MRSEKLRVVCLNNSTRIEYKIAATLAEALWLLQENPWYVVELHSNGTQIATNRMNGSTTPTLIIPLKNIIEMGVDIGDTSGLQVIL